MNQTTASMPTTPDKAVTALHDKLDRLLSKAKPGKREQVQRYVRDLYPKLKEHIALGKSLKEVLAAFNALTQSNVCLRTFNEMLSKERERRDKDGNPDCCHACGQSLKTCSSGASISPDSKALESNAQSLNPAEEE